MSLNVFSGSVAKIFPSTCSIPMLFLGLAFALLMPATSVAAFVPSGPPMATGQNKFLGCAYSAPQAPNFAAYFNQVTPENAGKWGSVEATRDVMNWTQLDEAYNFAKTNGLKFRFHILVWGSQQPSWISALTPSEKLEEIKEWFAAVAARYPDLDYVEVVNEPLHAPPNGGQIAFSNPAVYAANYSDALGGAGASGWEWLVQSFRLARQYFPGKKLVLNEYGLLNDSYSTSRYVQIINLLKAENLVDVVATQAHAFETYGVSTQTLTNNLATLAATGVPVMITEMDIDGATDQAQLTEYQRVFPVLWTNPSVVGITLWGYRPGLWRNAQGAYLVLADNTERPAMQWLKTYVGSFTPVVSAPRDFDGDGKSDIFLTNSSTGDRAMWLMNGTTIGTNAFVSTVPLDWVISGTGDFDGDGRADIFWTNTSTGDRAVWLLNGSTMTAGGYLGSVPVQWVVSGTGDFDGDGKADILWSNTVTGEHAMWLMNGITAGGGAALGVIPVAWVVSGVSDFDGDGKADIFLSNTTTGDRALWQMNGTIIATNAFVSTVPVNWAASGTGDFDGDGKADIFWTNTTTGDRAVWLMNGSVSVAGGYLGSVPTAWAVSSTGDYDGDGKADILWTNTSTGERAMWLMNGVTTSGGASLGIVPVEWVTNK